MRFDYPTDITFSCSKCGLCCGNTSKKVRRILLLKSDAERISSLTNLAVDAFAERLFGKLPYTYEIQKDSDGKCLFLKNEQCVVYEARPLICRFYPFELSTDSMGVSTFRVTNECPEVHKSTLKREKRLKSAYFKKLFDLAQDELNERPR